MSSNDDNKVNSSVTTTNGSNNKRGTTISVSSNNNNNNNNKKLKSSSIVQELVSPHVFEKEEEYKQACQTAKPYPHAHLTNIFKDDFVKHVREEIKANSKVNFKESDLFRVYQSIDLANVDIHDATNQESLKYTLQLREFLYSQEWTSYMERIAGIEPGTLQNSHVDCAFNCHAPGCHLLCHDDVIGTRKVSYIIYLTEDDWDTTTEGGSLELYESQLSKTSSYPLPVASVAPMLNSMAFFIVEPNVSFHAVQEVIGDRPRLSLQGWYHAKEPPSNIHQATLQQLKATRNDNDMEEQVVQTKINTTNQEFTAKDKEYLAKYLQPVYLTDDSIQDITKQFETESSVQLRNFLKDQWVPKLEPYTPQQTLSKYQIHSQQCQDGNKNDFATGSSTGTSSTNSKEWKLVGPAHLQRYLQYQSTSDQADNATIIGGLLHHLQVKVFESQEFARYLKRITGLDDITGISNSLIRKFRPGLDYTVAHYGLLAQESVLDATMCFVKDTDEQDVQAWESGDIGGFECYIEAEDYKEGGIESTEKDKEENETNDATTGGEGKASAASISSSAGAADEYNQDDDTQLLSVSASNNTLSLVYRDPGTMRFIKYVSHSAPSARYDISMVYEVPPDEAEDENNKDGNDEKGENNSDRKEEK